MFLPEGFCRGVLKLVHGDFVDTIIHWVDLLRVDTKSTEQPLRLASALVENVVPKASSFHSFPHISTRPPHLLETQAS